MTKKRKSTGSSKSSRAGSRLTLTGLVIIGLILGCLFLADWAGLVQVDWNALLEGEEIGQVVNQPAAPPPVVVEPVSGDWYQLFFSSPRYPDEPAARVDTIQQGLIRVINQAQASLDIAIYELDLDDLGDAILAARDRGVKVRLVTDSDTLAEDETLIRLKKARVPIVPDERNAIMHNKFVVVDGQSVWTGSWNFTINDTFRNNNNAIYIRSPQLAQVYAAEFEEMFSQKAFGPTSPANTPYAQLQLGETLVETCFAPEDECAAQLVTQIGQAQQSIRFMAFSFTHDGIGQAVIDRAKAGVAVQGVFETRGSETEHSELARMKKQQLDVWQDGNPYTLHHKVFILDDKTVVMGSFNFSSNADESNDENMLVIHNQEIARQYLSEFERVYAQAQEPKK